VSITDIQTWVKQFEKRHPGLIAETINREFITVPRLTQLFQELLRAGFGIKDFGGILEGIAAYCSSFGATLSAEDRYDVTDLLDFLRVNRARGLNGTLLGNFKDIRKIIISDDVEQTLKSVELSETNGERIPAISKRSDPSTVAELKRSLHETISPLAARGAGMIVILCEREVRSRVRAALHSKFSLVPIVSEEELGDRSFAKEVGLTSSQTEHEPAAVWGV
jgi:flagellar biosynthesis component FlhA